MRFRCPECFCIVRIQNKDPFGQNHYCLQCQAKFILCQDNLEIETTTVNLSLLSFHCSLCNCETKVLEEALGKKLKCPDCQVVVVLSKENTKKVKRNSSAKEATRRYEKKVKILFSTNQKLPEKLGSYKVLKLLGIGAMGKVYLVEKKSTGEKFALKALITGSGFKKSQERFLQEAEITARLSHPNIVTFHDMGYDRGQYFFTMEFIEGESFENLLPKLELKYSLEILLQIVLAIGYAHKLNVVHRDLNPNNVMVTKDNLAKVMDFGVVKFVEETNCLTSTGTVIGTIPYMAPEQATGQIAKIDHRSDLYSLGVILYKILTNNLPFKGKTHLLINNIIYQEPIPPLEIKENIPQELSNICLKAIGKERKDRYQSAEEFYQAIKPHI